MQVCISITLDSVLTIFYIAIMPYLYTFINLKNLDLKKHLI